MLVEADKRSLHESPSVHKVACAQLLTYIRVTLNNISVESYIKQSFSALPPLCNLRPAERHNR